MFPISDVIPSRTRPVVTIALIAATTLGYLYQLQLDRTALLALVERFGVVPAALHATALVTSQFLHADLLHVAGNLVFLWIFGDNVEDRLGHAWFLLFYIAGGALAALAHVAADPSASVPMIGASGAVAAVMGAYFVLYPQSRILTAVFLVVFMDVIEIPAVFFLGVWLLLQVAHGALASPADVEGVAFWAHGGGFVVGAAVGLLVRVLQGGRRDYWRATS